METRMCRFLSIVPALGANYKQNFLVGASILFSVCVYVFSHYRTQFGLNAFIRVNDQINLADQYCSS